jgi:UDP-N-acetylglucosamine--N-acetylmuramyl-(pentapeptide) pyrophosphoryl-undecaprenol N-acetylglucosamine transferase
MNRPGPEVLIMAGGTGGHIFPGLAVADCLRQRGVPVRWLGARGGMECQKVAAAGIPIDVVDISGLRGKGLARWLTLPWRLLRAVGQALRVIGRHRPRCAVSFGGYAAGPGGLAARLRGVPLLVHEQNRIPGMTNRVLARLADRVLQAFPGSWPESLAAITCGNPVRHDVVGLPAPAERLAGREGPVRLLVTGGSQGAMALNRLVPAALGLLRGQTEFEVRHQCGRNRLQETRAAYEDYPAEVTEFIEDMAAAYAWADLVICRAGALTVSEVAAAGLPAIFVPFPHAVDDHQTRNAGYLVDSGGGLLLPEAAASPGALAELLSSLAADRGRLLEMATQARACAVPDAARRVADLCMEYAAA